MAKFKVNHDFTGKKEDKKFESGKEYNFTVERAEEINDLMEKRYNRKETLTRVEEPKKEKKSNKDE